MVVEVQNNSFYRKHTVSASGAISVSPHFTDYARGGTNTAITFEGGTKSQSWLISGTTPDPLKYGGGELAGASLVMYCSGVTMSNMATLPEVKAYSLVSGATLSEGGMVLQTGSANSWKGDDLAVYTAFCDPTIYTYYEGFDGEQTLGEVTKSAPGKKLSEPYVDLNAYGMEIMSKTYVGGTYSWISNTSWGASLTDLGGHSEGVTFYRKYFATDMDGNRVETSTTVRQYFPGIQEYRDVVMPYGGNYMWLKPYNRDKLNDLWVPAVDYRTGDANIHVFTPMWKWEDIRAYVKWNKVEDTTTETADDESSITVNVPADVVCESTYALIDCCVASAVALSDAMLSSSSIVPTSVEELPIRRPCFTLNALVAMVHFPLCFY